MKSARDPYTKELRNLRKTIGANIREHRLKHRITLVRLSNLTKISPHRLDMFEMGKDRIDLHHMLRIAAALKCDVASLLALSC